MKNSFLIVSLIIATLSFASCSGKGAKDDKKTCEPVKTSAVKAEDFKGEWVVYTVGTDTIKLPEDRTPFIAFNDSNRISGFTGCNRLLGTYDIDIAKSTIDLSKLGTTKMACPDDAIEQKITSALASVTKFKFVKCDRAEYLVLLDAKDLAVVTLEKHKGRKLEAAKEEATVEKEDTTKTKEKTDTTKTKKKK